MNLWLFGYGSLIWRPDIEYMERWAAELDVGDLLKRAVREAKG